MTAPGHLAPGLIALLIVVVFLIACVVGFMLLAARAKEDEELAQLQFEAHGLRAIIAGRRKQHKSVTAWRVLLSENMLAQMRRERQLDGWRT